MSLSIAIDYYGTEERPSEWPKSLDFKRKEDLSGLTFIELWNRAVAAKVTDFVIAITEYNDEQGKRCYQIYDAVRLRKCLMPPQQGLDPISRCPIKDIHYLSVKCFAYDPKTISRRVSLKNLTLREFFKDKPLKALPSFSEDAVKEIALNAINYEAARGPEAEEIRQAQYVIGANLINQEKDSPAWQEGVRWLDAAGRARLYLAGLSDP